MCAAEFSSVKCFACLLRLISVRITCKLETRLFNLIIRLHGLFFFIAGSHIQRYTARKRNNSNPEFQFLSIFINILYSFTALSPKAMIEQSVSLFPYGWLYHKSQDVMIALKWHPFYTHCTEHNSHLSFASLRILLPCLPNI